MDEAYKMNGVAKAQINLPEHKCGLHLTHNVHRNYYEPAEQYLGRFDGDDWWESEEAKERAIKTDEIWELQWYPDTPVSFNHVFAPTLDELLSFALTCK